MRKFVQIARQIRPAVCYFSGDGFVKRRDFRLDSNSFCVYSLARNVQSRKFSAGIANFDTGGWFLVF